MGVLVFLFSVKINRFLQFGGEGSTSSEKEKSFAIAHPCAQYETEPIRRNLMKFDERPGDILSS